MPIFQGAALASSERAADASALASADVAALLAQEAVEQLESQLPVKKKRVRKRMTADMVQWCHGIGFNELCWMCPTESDPSFAHLCLVIQVAQGMCFFMKEMPLSSYSLFLGDTNRVKILICDEEVCVAQWVNVKSTVLYPYDSTDPNFTERFSKRADALCTPAFNEALRLAEMYSDESNDRREEALKLLQMGSLARQKLVEQHQVFAEHRQRCEEATAARKQSKEEAKAARKQSKEEAKAASRQQSREEEKASRKQSREEEKASRKRSREEEKAAHLRSREEEKAARKRVSANDKKRSPRQSKCSAAAERLSTEPSARTHKTKVSVKPPRRDKAAGGAVANVSLPSSTKKRLSKKSIINKTIPSAQNKKSKAPKAKNVAFIQSTSKTKPKSNNVAKKGKSVGKSPKKASNQDHVTKVVKNKALTKCPSKKSKSTSKDVCTSAKRRNMNPQETGDKIPPLKRRKGDAGATIKIMKGGSQTNDKGADATTSKKRKREATISLTSTALLKRPGVKNKSAPKASTVPKCSRKKQKHSEIGTDVAPTLLTNGIGAQQCLQLQPQIVRAVQPKRDSSGFELCKHNERPYNCRICSTRTFVSWKPKTNEDGSDDGL